VDTFDLGSPSTLKRSWTGHGKCSGRWGSMTPLSGSGGWGNRNIGMRSPPFHDQTRPTRLDVEAGGLTPLRSRSSPEKPGIFAPK
jgi:hypothetical protein